MTFTSILNAHFSAVCIVLVVMTIVILTRYHEESPASFVKEAFSEIASLMKGIKSARSIDALFGILIFVIALSIVFGSPFDWIGGAINGQSENVSIVIAHDVLSCFVLLIVAGVFLLSIKLCKNLDG